jgi:ADP-ribose pyrophosphatase YjhB (NUDIX family)
MAVQKLLGPLAITSVSLPSSETEEEEPKLYPLVVADVALFSVDTSGLQAHEIHKGLKVLLVTRSEDPFQGMWSLPGGILQPKADNSLQATAERVLRQKVSVEVPYLSEVRSFSGRERDPRGWSVGVLYYALLPRDQVNAVVKDSVDAVEWVPAVDHGLGKLAFDHDAQLYAAVEALRDKVERQALPLHLMPVEFTLGALQKCCEAILGHPLDKSSFRRRLVTDPPVVIGLDRKEKAGAQRPSQLYRAPDGFSFDEPENHHARSRRKAEGSM